MTSLVRSAFVVLFVFAPIKSKAFLSTVKPDRQNHRFLVLSESKHPLVLSGEALFHSTDPNSGEHETDEPLLFIPPAAAHALIEAGNAWASDWEQVTFACADAATSFRNAGHEHIADEFHSISEIGGCTSVGPPSSVPNLSRLQVHFHKLAKETGKEEYNVISNAIGELVQQYS